MTILGKDVFYDFIFTATSKKGEYFFNRFMKTHPVFSEVTKADNVYSGFTKLENLHKLSVRSYKFGTLNIGTPHFNKTIIVC